MPMMNDQYLIEHVKIAIRFQRSIMLDTDLNKNNSLDGFVCPQSSRDALLAIANYERVTFTYDVKGLDT